MLKHWLFLFISLSLVAFAQPCATDCETMTGELLRGVPYQATRFPVTTYSKEDLENVFYAGTGEEVTALWLPSDAELASLEEAIKKELRAKVTGQDYDPYRETLESLNDYKRQYVGAVIKGEKMIIATFDRCSVFAEGELESQFISRLPMDGGSCFLELVYDPQRKTFPVFYIHGEA